MSALGVLSRRLGGVRRAIAVAASSSSALSSSASNYSSNELNTRLHRITTRGFASEVKMPSLSPTMETGTIVKWLKAEGEAFSAGDALCEIQTDKAVVTMEADEDGVLAKIFVKENVPDIMVGLPIAMMAEDGEDWKEVNATAKPSSAAEASAAPTTVQAATPSAPPKATPQAPSGTPVNHLLGPAVKLLLLQYGIDSSQVKPTGRDGILLKSDVHAHITTNKLQPAPIEAAPAVQTGTPVSAPAGPTPMASSTEFYTDIELTNMRRTIAKRLAFSKATVPHAYAAADIDLGALMDVRRQLKENDGIKVSVNDFIIKGVANALAVVRELNVQYDEQSGSVRAETAIDVSVAVATDAGLITPIVRNADQLAIGEISDKVKEMAARAKENKLQLHEFQGGTFTVSNLGMFGIKDFTAIINPPQAAILAVGGSQPYIHVDSHTMRNKMTVTLCYDNRAVSEVSACRFLECLQRSLEDPDTMLMGGDAELTDQVLARFLL